MLQMELESYVTGRWSPLSRISNPPIPICGNRQESETTTFKGNPFSLTVQEPDVESWLRDSGYLEVLDHRSSSSSSSAALSSATTSPADTTLAYSATFFSLSATLLSLFTLNPLSKLTSDDFSHPTPSWTDSFFGSLESYSFPASPTQARLRVHENAKRFARNYATLLILFFSCSL